MNREEPPEDNVPFLLGSLVRPIGRGVPDNCQEDQTAAAGRHGSAFSPGRKTRLLVVWGPCELSLVVQFTPCGGDTCLQSD
jgi:hypothetical protein